MKKKKNHTRMKKLSKFNHNLTLMLLDRVQITHERTSIMPNKKKKTNSIQFFWQTIQMQQAMYDIRIINKLCMT